MPTSIRAGLLDPEPQRSSKNILVLPKIYVDEAVLQVIDDADQLVIQFTYEELKGVIAILEAEQQKKNIYLTIASKKN